MAKGGIAGSACDKRMEHKSGCQYAKGGFVLDSESKDHYVIKHPKGDVLKIAKHGLSSEMHNQIKKYAKGGEVKEEPKPDANPISQSFMGATGSQGIQDGIKNIKNYADGTVDEPVPGPEAQIPQTEEMPPAQMEAMPERNLASEPQEVAPPPPAVAAAPSNEPERVINPELKENVVGAFHKMMDVLKSGGPTGYIADKVATGLTKAATVPNPKAPQQPSMQQASADQPGYSNVPTMPPREQAPQANQNPSNGMPSVDPEVKKLQQITDAQQGRMQEAHTRAVDILHDLNTQKIDFNRAWSNKSVPSKILAGIGMALSGIGSGITKQPNMAMEMINKEIERDIDQQKSEIGKKATVLDGYLKSYGNETAATNAYREDLQALVAAKMQQYSLKMQGNMMKGMNSGEQGMGQYLSFLRMTNPNMAKSVEERMIPSLGGAVADIPVTPDDRESISKGQELDTVLDRLEKFSEIHSGSMNPAIINQGKALAAQAKAILQVRNHQGVFKESTQKFDENFIPEDPTKFFASVRSSPQYAETRNLNKLDLHNTVGKYFVRNPLDGMMQPQLTQRPGVMRPMGNVQNVSNRR